MGEIEDLQAKVERLEIALAEARRADTFEIDTINLSNEEQQVLRLVAAGLRDRDAVRIAGVSEGFVDKHFRESLHFAKALQEVRHEYDEWLESHVKFVMPTVWAEVMKIITTDTETLRSQDSSYARTMLQQKVKLLDKLLKTNYGEESRLVVEDGGGRAALQFAETNAEMVAEHMVNLLRKKERGDLDAMLPENQIIDVLPKDFKPIFNEQPRNMEGEYKCLECDELVQNLRIHLMTHDISLQEYAHRHNLDPLESYDTPESE